MRTSAARARVRGLWRLHLRDADALAVCSRLVRSSSSTRTCETAASPPGTVDMIAPLVINSLISKFVQHEKHVACVRQTDRRARTRADRGEVVAKEELGDCHVHVLCVRRIECRHDVLLVARRGFGVSSMYALF
eukprot:6213040-Pleurochrysis_carterae.AAC.1